ncbi:MAG: 5-formyltetrahydrofolate cyclo-ligase [Spirochaetaceae bacterium]|jgi:5-formyltetrahydrofolate cyclo-ligase|nr:5-formyltetrahydrofolate cyclo-ligase [Spirochaetaceae bacterium]
MNGAHETGARGPVSIAESKRHLRLYAKKRLSALPRESFVRQGEEAALILVGQRIWQEFSRVLIYLSMPDELETSPLLKLAFKAGKDVYSPKVESDTSMRFFRVNEDESCWVRGPYDIREPRGREEDLFRPEDGPALVISPGLAFDIEGRRLGRGKGYYDRFFEKLFSQSPESKICAFCMNECLVAFVPAEPLDRKVDFLCTAESFFVV